MKTLLLDMDRVLAPFLPEAGTEKVNEILVEKYKEIGQKMGDEFGQIFHDLDTYYHDLPNKRAPQLIKDLNNLNIEVPNGFDKSQRNFMWSRGLWLKYLFNKYSITASGKEIVEIIEQYWQAIGKSCQVFKDAAEFLSESKNPRFIITSTDSILFFEDDKIIYDADYATKRKIERMILQGITKYIPEKHIFVGEPIDKPKQGFWDRVLKAANTSPENCIAVDDSIKVIRSAISLGMKGILLDRDSYYTEMKERPGIYVVDMSEFESLVS